MKRKIKEFKEWNVAVHHHQAEADAIIRISVLEENRTEEGYGKLEMLKETVK